MAILLLGVAGAALLDWVPTRKAQAASPCMLVVDSALHPTRVLLGEELTVTLSMVPLCWDWEHLLQFVFVVDGSRAMEGAPNRDLTRDLRRLVDGLALDSNASTRVAVIEHGDGGARVICSLTNDRATLVGCVGRIGASGEPNPGAALREARRLLDRAQGPKSWGTNSRVVVLATGPDLRVGCTDAVREADKIKAAGALLITGCAAGSCESDCARRLATSYRYALDRLSDPALLRWLKQVQRPLRQLLVKSLQLDVQLAEDVTLLSVEPQPSLETRSPRFRSWHTSFVPREGLTISLRMRPERLGSVALLTEATVVFTDNVDFGDASEVTVPPVIVMRPRALPSATPDATVVPAPTAISPPTPTSSSSPTPRTVPFRLHLPRVLAQRAPGVMGP